MIRTPPEHNTKNPPGQIRNEDWKPPKYLRDVIKRVQDEEKEQVAPTPLPDGEKRLNRLLGALLDLCQTTESAWTDEDGNRLSTVFVSTKQIRKIIKENS